MGESERAGGKAMKCTIPSFGQGFFLFASLLDHIGFYVGAHRRRVWSLGLAAER